MYPNESHCLSAATVCINSWSYYTKKSIRYAFACLQFLRHLAPFEISQFFTLYHFFPLRYLSPPMSSLFHFWDTIILGQSQIFQLKVSINVYLMNWQRRNKHFPVDLLLIDLHRSKFWLDFFRNVVTLSSLAFDESVVVLETLLLNFVSFVPFASDNKTVVCPWKFLRQVWYILARPESISVKRHALCLICKYWTRMNIYTRD